MTLHLSDAPCDSAPEAGDLVVPQGFPALAFAPAPTRKRKAGWTAERQHRFIERLVITASVADAAEEAGVDPASAYRLRDRAGGEDFARAWAAALAVSATRLESIVLDRAINGRCERVYAADGTLVHERRVPSDDLLKWLLARLDPITWGNPHARSAALAAGHDPRGVGRAALPQALAALADVAPEVSPIPRILTIEHREGEALLEGDISGSGQE